MKKVFKLEEIKSLVNEELEKYSKKQELISEKAKLEAELEALNEVYAGEEMSKEQDYHDGQKKPEFEMKGSHIVEEDDEVVDQAIETGHIDNQDTESMDSKGDYELPAWMLSESLEEEVDASSLEKDLEEMIGIGSAQEISETIEEMEMEEGNKGSKEEEDFNPVDYSGLGEGREEEEGELHLDAIISDEVPGEEFVPDMAGDEFIADVEEGGDLPMYESKVQKRRDNILSENSINRMRVLGGIDKRKDY